MVKYLDASTLAGTVQGSVGMGARVLVMGAFTVLGGLVLGLVRARLQPEAEAAEADDLPDELPLVPDQRPFAPLCHPGAPPARRRGLARPAGPRRPRRPNRRRPAPSLAGSAPGAAHTRDAAGPARPRPPGAPRCPASRRPPATVAPRPRPADPDTEPTLPGQRPVQPWWPDDLDDLFS